MGIPEDFNLVSSRLSEMIVGTTWTVSLACPNLVCLGTNNVVKMGLNTSKIETAMVHVYCRCVRRSKWVYYDTIFAGILYKIRRSSSI